MLDFNSKSALSDRINYYIDTALELEQQFQPERDYLGGSRAGVECERALQYEFLKVPHDLGKTFSGRVLRIFERGHWVEAAMIEWMKKAGFGILEGTKTGKQFGFAAHKNIVAGHCDGIIISGPFEFGPWPRLWENKGIQEKGFKALVKDKLKKQYPVYYAQVQYYMKHFNLSASNALFSAVNMNTMEIYWEDVVYDSKFTDKLEERIKRIILASEHGELLPRGFNSRDYFQCKWCNWNNRCWSSK